MGGFDTSGLSSLAQQVLKQQSQLAGQRAQQANQQSQATGNYANPVATLIAPPGSIPARTGAAQSPQQMLLGQMMLQNRMNPYGGY